MNQFIHEFLRNERNPEVKLPQRTRASASNARSSTRNRVRGMRGEQKEEGECAKSCAGNKGIKNSCLLPCENTVKAHVKEFQSKHTIVVSQQQQQTTAGATILILKIDHECSSSLVQAFSASGTPIIQWCHKNKQIVFG